MHALGPDWMDPQYLLDTYGTAFFGISLLIVFIECVHHGVKGTAIRPASRPPAVGAPRVPSCRACVGACPAPALH